jgi:hypothetical protein
MRNLATGLVTVGTLLIVGGLVLAFVVVPSMKAFPDDVDTTRTYELIESPPDEDGEPVDLLTLLQVEESENEEGEIVENYVFYQNENPDFRLERHIEVEEVDGDKTLVRETQTFFDDDTVLVEQVKLHALDRKTMEFLPIADIPAEWQEQEGYWDREGLVIGWGIGVEQQDYTGWSDDYLETVTLEFQEETEWNDLDVYYFTSVSEEQPIHRDHVLRLGLPERISVDQLISLAKNLAVTRGSEHLVPVIDNLRDDLEEATPNSNMVRLFYSYSYEGDYWVEPVTGVLINTRKHEKRVVTFDEELLAEVPLLNQLVPLTINEFTYEATAQSQDDAKSDAEENIDSLNLFGTMLPIGLVAFGLVFEAGGVFALLSKRDKSNADETAA